MADKMVMSGDLEGLKSLFDKVPDSKKHRFIETHLTFEHFYFALLHGHVCVAKFIKQHNYSIKRNNIREAMVIAAQTGETTVVRCILQNFYQVRRPSCC